MCGMVVVLPSTQMKDSLPSGYSHSVPEIKFCYGLSEQLLDCLERLCLSLHPVCIFGNSHWYGTLYNTFRIWYGLEWDGVWRLYCPLLFCHSIS